MPHPLFATLLRRPELVAEHLANYGALVREETALAASTLISRVVAGVLAAVAGMLALALIGVAVMLGALHAFHWALVAVPGVAVVIALLAAWRAAQSGRQGAFAQLRSQFDADLQMLHLAGERHAD